MVYLQMLVAVTKLTITVQYTCSDEMKILVRELALLKVRERRLILLDHIRLACQICHVHIRQVKRVGKDESERHAEMYNQKIKNDASVPSDEMILYDDQNSFIYSENCYSAPLRTCPEALPAQPLLKKNTRETFRNLVGR